MEGATSQPSVERLQGSEDRPLCECHGERMNRNGSKKWTCSVKGREKSRRWRVENRAHWREYDRRRVRMFGPQIVVPDPEFVAFARRLRDERKAALKAAA